MDHTKLLEEIRPVLYGMCCREYGHPDNWPDNRATIMLYHNVESALNTKVKKITSPNKQSFQFPKLEEVVKVVESSYIGELSAGRERWIASRVYHIMVGN